jgi:hypothetical protein
MASSEAEKIHSSVKPTIARGQHQFNRRHYFLSDSFFSNSSIGLAVYISPPPQWVQFISLDSPDITYTLLRFESNEEHNSSSFNLSSHQDSSESQEIELVHSFLVFDLAQVKARACYSWWLAAPRRSWWSGSFGACRGDCGSLKEVLVTLFMIWAPPCRRWQTETPSERQLCMWHGRWHNPWWVSQRGLGVIAKSSIPREKSSCLIYFQAFTSCLLLCLVSFACLCSSLSSLQLVLGEFGRLE